MSWAARVAYYTRIYYYFNRRYTCFKTPPPLILTYLNLFIRNNINIAMCSARLWWCFALVDKWMILRWVARRRAVVAIPINDPIQIPRHDSTVLATRLLCSHCFDDDTKRRETWCLSMTTLQCRTTNKVHDCNNKTRRRMMAICLAHVDLEDTLTLALPDLRSGWWEWDWAKIAWNYFKIDFYWKNMVSLCKTGIMHLSNANSSLELLIYDANRRREVAMIGFTTV